MSNPVRQMYRAGRYKRQLKGWLKGKPEHDYTDDQCCPDFSCCYPELLSPPAVREEFMEAHRKRDNKRLTEMLEGFFEAGAIRASKDVEREVADHLQKVAEKEDA